MVSGCKQSCRFLEVGIWLLMVMAKLHLGSPLRLLLIYERLLTMRLAYLIRVDVSKESGVLKKIVTQAKTWASMGHDVRIFTLNPQGPTWEGLELSGVPYNIFHWSNLLNKFTSWQRLLDAIDEWCPTVIYYRAGLYHRGFKKLAQHFPVVAEVNTSDLDEYRVSLSRSKYIYNRMTRRKQFVPCTGIVCVTSELAQCYAGFGKPMAVITNGIDLTNYSPLPPTDNKTPRFIFLGTPGYPWHGVDKILTLAKLCPDFIFDIVGYNINDIHDWMPPNVNFHGYLKANQYESLLCKADVAIGTLSLHVKNMEEACPLKVREYLAYGLPIIIGYTDPDLQGNVPYVLKIPNTPDNILQNVESIRKFAQAWMGSRVPRELIVHLDSSIKEKQRLEFMSRCLQYKGQKYTEPLRVWTP